MESTITNEDLLYLLKNTDRKKICLLDTRPSDIFHQYRIISCDVINIPKDILVLGYELYSYIFCLTLNAKHIIIIKIIFSRLTADTLKNKLDESYKEKWIMRHNYDFIIILDQGTEEIDDDQRLIILRNALLKWDPTHDNSKKLKFLKGGYEDFNHLCPWETTQFEMKKSIDDNEPLSDIELDTETESEESKSIILYQ